MYYKAWKPKHQHALVSKRVVFDGHGGGDESYVMIDLHNDTAATSALVSGDNLMSKRPSLQGRLFALPNSAHPTEDTETANQSQKPLANLQALSANQMLLKENSGHQLVVQSAVLETPTDRSSTTVDSEKPLLV